MFGKRFHLLSRVRHNFYFRRRLRFSIAFTIVCSSVTTFIVFMVRAPSMQRHFNVFEKQVLKQLPKPTEKVLKQHPKPTEGILKQLPKHTEKILQELPKPTEKIEIRHIAFLKVHKAASSTIQNILYRFGLSRNLSFVLPISSHYLSKEKNVYSPVYRPMSTSGKFDILCNHAVFNIEKFKQYMYADAVYLAIVREPFKLFVSSAMYYRYVWPAQYLKIMNESTFITDLIINPEKHESKPLTRSNTFNSMSRDFGFAFSSLAYAKNIPKEVFNSFLKHINDSFDLVLIVERFEESVIMLKRRLGWTTKDVIYIKNNARDPKLIRQINMDDKTMDMFKLLNKFDYQIYEMFLRRFDRQVNNERLLEEEVTSFRSILSIVNNFCNSGNHTQYITIEQSTWNDEFKVFKDDCELLLLNEIPFFIKLRELHRAKIKKTKALAAALKDTKVQV